MSIAKEQHAVAAKKTLRCVEQNQGLRIGWIVAVACSLFPAFGCGGSAKPDYPTVKLAGTVKVDGVPVEEGRIRFSPTTPDQSGAAEGAISAGRYSVDNAPIGNILVTFTGTKKTGRIRALYGQKTEESVNVIPARYSCGLPVNVDAANNGNRNFDLTSGDAHVECRRGATLGYAIHTRQQARKPPSVHST